MKINNLIETPQGIVKFEGEIEGQELEYVVEMGLKTLFLLGAIKAHKAETESALEEKESNSLQ